ncbi:hypothetical protein FOA24_36820 [Bacillus thuringiensis]|uniref:hypothetical protein n=1 Tax=Bacillus thuringiensis TaxID=1428 RepID=UPI0033395D73
MAKNFSEDIQAIIITANGEYDIFLFPTMHNNLFHLITDNFNEGYNHYELYIDQAKDLLHIYDDMEYGTGGTSIVNRIGEYLIKKICSSLNLNNSEQTKAMLYYPEQSADRGVGIVTYGYHTEKRKYDFGHPFDENNTYGPFINMAKNRKF